MRSCGCTLMMGLVPLQEETLEHFTSSLSTLANTKERPCEDMGRRRLSATQGASPQQTLTLLVP